MKPRYIFFAFFVHTLFSVRATVSEFSDTPDMIGTTETRKTELTSLSVSARMGDIIIISAPVISRTNTLYYLSNPRGDSSRLNINTSRATTNCKETSRICSKYNHYVNNEGKVKTIIASTKKRNLISHENNCFNSYSDYDKKPNDFTIGPLGENDHGNWVLSLYSKDDRGWIELFQVITMEIVESLPTYAPKTKLIPGQTFAPRFLYPINNLESCEISAPRTTFDRFYDRDKLNLAFCEFRIPNLTKDDEGTWTIIAVGKIVYKGVVYLQIDDAASL